MESALLSNHHQAVVSSLLLIGVFALFAARFGRPLRWIAVVLAAALLDQASKAAVLVACRGNSFGRDYSFLHGRLGILYTGNYALGFDASFPFLLLSTLAFVLLLMVLYQRLGRARYRLSATMEISLALITGGLLGILLDRIRLQYVVNFLEFGPNSYIYNLADIFAIIGGALALTRFGELATFLRIGLRRPLAALEPSSQTPPSPRSWRRALRIPALCVATTVALFFLWRVGVNELPPLHEAARKGDLKRVQRLVRRGAPINRARRRRSHATPVCNQRSQS